MWKKLALAAGLTLTVAACNTESPFARADAGPIVDARPPADGPDADYTSCGICYYPMVCVMGNCQ